MVHRSCTTKTHKIIFKISHNFKLTKRGKAMDLRRETLMTVSTSNPRPLQNQQTEKRIGLSQRYRMELTVCERERAREYGGEGW